MSFVCAFFVHPKKNLQYLDTPSVFFGIFKPRKKHHGFLEVWTSKISSKVRSKSLAEHLHHEVVGLEAALHRLILVKDQGQKTRRKKEDDMYMVHIYLSISWHIYIFISVYMH